MKSTRAIAKFLQYAWVFTNIYCIAFFVVGIYMASSVDDIDWQINIGKRFKVLPMILGAAEGIIIIITALLFLTKGVDFNIKGIMDVLKLNITIIDVGLLTIGIVLALQIVVISEMSIIVSTFAIMVIGVAAVFPIISIFYLLTETTQDSQ